MIDKWKKIVLLFKCYHDERDDNDECKEDDDDEVGWNNDNGEDYDNDDNSNDDDDSNVCNCDYSLIDQWTILDPTVSQHNLSYVIEINVFVYMIWYKWQQW